MKKFSLITLLFFILITVTFAGQEKPYVLVISFDGFRWDYALRGITPNLDKVARQGVKALTLQPSFPSKTFPTHYSIVTGLYPQNHGLIDNRFQNPFSGDVYRLGDTLSVRDDRWYHGESIWGTANRQGIKTASFFWPGSETHLEYRHPTYFKRYDGSVSHEDRIKGVIDWLQLPEADRPRFILMYFSDTDDIGHKYGPESTEINEAVRLLDKRLGELMDQLQQINMLQRIHIMVISDHGMTALDNQRVILLSDIFGKEVPQFFISGPMIQFHSNDPIEATYVYNRLKENERGYRAYYREEFPEYFHYAKNPFVGNVIAIADLGYSFIRDQKTFERMNSSYRGGDHGYDNFALDMHGIFVAMGPKFRENYATGTILNIDLYPLICRLLGIIPNQMIDGRLERVEYLLK